MSAQATGSARADGDELSFFEAPGAGPSADLAKARSVSPRHLLVRFAFGAGTSAVAGAMAVVFSPRAAGPMLAFPAILAASLTLIADEDSRRAAREDARGAVIGAVALAAFALAGYELFGRLPAPLVLLVALAGWILVACGLYVLLWAPSRGLFARGSRRAGR